MIVFCRTTDWILSRAMLQREVSILGTCFSDADYPDDVAILKWQFKGSTETLARIEAASLNLGFDISFSKTMKNFGAGLARLDSQRAGGLCVLYFRDHLQ